MIPCLLLSDGALIKTTRFKDARYVGDPINAVRIFNEKEVDELVILDVDASKIGSVPNYELLSEIATECFMPVCYGGGVKSVEDALRLVSLGFEKIAVNSSAMARENIVKEISSVLGVSSTVVGVDVKRDWMGRWRVFNAATQVFFERPLLEHLSLLVDQGGGEIFLNDVDRDGTRMGYDLDLVKKVSDAVTVPVIASGGAGTITDFRAATLAGASAAAAGSMFVFQGKHRAVLISYPKYGDLELVMSSL